MNALKLNKNLRSMFLLNKVALPLCLSIISTVWKYVKAMVYKIMNTL